MKSPITIIHIAKACNVSPSTVSLALNNSPRIKNETRLKVLEAAEKMGYQPNVNARGLVSKSSKILSVTVPPLSHVFADIYFGEIISGVYDQAQEEGYKILLDIAQGDYIGNKEHLSILQTRRADGTLFIASTIEDVYLKDFETRSFPVLLVNHFYPDSPLNFLTADYPASAKMAMKHLLGFGHKNIGLIIGTNTHTGLSFRDTFIAEGVKNGLPTNQIPWTSAEWDERGGYEAAKHLIARYPDLTAIMAGNDRMAIGAMRYLISQGISVPDQISVMGMDNIEAAKYSSPGLTSIRLDLYQLGKQSCKRLLEIIRGDTESVHEIVQTTLIARESTGPVRSA